jgi:antitoxin (DNA-binding transcriptional repressor) of toxin-antitoxin stability system
MQVTIHEAKTHLSKLLQKALGGEEVIIAKGKKPIAKLVVYTPRDTKRILGTAKGSVSIASDFDTEVKDFDEYMR